MPRLLVLLVCPIALSAQQNKSMLPAKLYAERAALFAILDAFDPLDTSRLQFVEFTTGRFERNFKGQATYEQDRGFLLAVDAKRFRVRTLDWRILDLPRKGGSKANPTKPGFVRADLRRYAGRVHAPAAGGFSRTSRNLMNPTARHIALARACARRKWWSLADALWLELPRSGSSWTRPREQLGSALHWQLVVDFARPGLSWKDLIARHRLWLKHFPRHFYGGRVRARIARLQAMLADGPAKRENARVRKLRGDFAPVLDRQTTSGISFPLKVSHSVYLRAVDGTERHGSEAGAPFLAADRQGILMLLAVLDDPSFTRTVRAEPYSLHIQTVGDKSRALIERITGIAVRSRGDRARVQQWLDANKRR